MSDATVTDVPGPLGRRPLLPPGYTAGRRAGPGENGTSALVRWTVVATLVLAAATMVVINQAVRAFEAHLFAPLAGLVIGTGHTGTAGSIVYVGLGDSSAFGLQITGECTTSVLLVPLLLVIAGYAAAVRGVPMRRVVAAVAVAVATLGVVNGVRIAVVAFSTWHWGEGGFRISHVLIGSAFALVGFALALVLTVRTLTWRRSGEGEHRGSRHAA